jgi:photosystem II stability/assembly factor-like uncharacterized protein
MRKWLLIALLTVATSPGFAQSDKLSKSAASKILLLDAARAGSRLVAVGDRGYILASDDNGDSWRRVSAPEGPLLTSVFFADAKTGWAVGHDSMILSTRDGGEQWTKQFSSPDEAKPLLDVLFTDIDKGFAVGAYGAFLTTQDGGKTWKSGKVSQEDKHLNAITALNDGRLMIVGEAGTMLFSSDRGTTWTAAESPYKGSYFGVVEAADKSIIIFGLRGRIFRTADGGISWTAIEVKVDDKPLQSSLLGGARLADGSIMLAGIQGTVLLSKDHGASFQKLKTDTAKQFSTVVQGTPNSVVLLGESGPRDFLLK